MHGIDTVKMGAGLSGWLSHQRLRFDDRRSAIPGGFEVGTQIRAKLSGFALHLPNQLALFVRRSSCPVKLVAQPTNALQPFRELGALIDGPLVIHGGSMHCVGEFVTSHDRTSWLGDHTHGKAFGIW
jgi:hypothetical protein